jgi:glycosyltransferase involved in cell wall biosynthesis
MSDCIKIGILTNIPSPYRIPLFNEIGATEDVNLNVFFMSQSQKNRHWDTSEQDREFGHTFLRGTSLYSYKLDRGFSINYGVVDELRGSDLDVLVVTGYNSVASWMALAYARLSGVPIVPWSGSWSGSIRLSNPIVSTIRETFTRSGRAWLAYGTKSAESLVSWGADAERVFTAINTVDIAEFAKASNEVDGEGGFDGVELLYCGQLTARKNVGSLIESLANFGPDQVRLRVVGEGPLATDLQEMAVKVAPEVVFEGFTQRHELVGFYAKADLLVLPSYEEVWGLVVNEALACGTPVLVSRNCGCACDLVRDGRNGSTFKPTVESLRRLLTTVIEDGVQYESPASIKQDSIARFGIQRSAEQVVLACQTAYKMA